jgi:hypothetical protein
MEDRHEEAALREQELMPTHASVNLHEFARNLIYAIDLYIIYVHILDGSLVSLILRSLTQISLSIPHHGHFFRMLVQNSNSSHERSSTEPTVTSSSVLFKRNVYIVVIMNSVFMLRHTWVTPGHSLFLDILGTGGRPSVSYLLCLDMIFMMLQWLYIHLPYYKTITRPSTGLSMFTWERDLSAEEHV